MAQKDFAATAKVMSKGQITIPKEVRTALGVDDGSSVTFIVDGNNVRIVNSSIYAMQLLQQEMSGVAAEAGITEEDIIGLVKELRDKQTKS